MLTLIYSYYDNPGMLALHLSEWAKYEGWVKEKIRIILVDDCSPKTPAEPIVRTAMASGNLPKLSLYRIDVDIPWNLDGARNLAMSECETDWALMTDMDRILLADQAAIAVELEKEQGNFYRPFQRWLGGESLGRPHPNSFIIHQQDFWNAGGYDEDFAGSYGGDGNFRKNLKAVCNEVIVESPFLDCCEKVVPDSITQGLPRKEKGSYCLSIPKLAAKVKGPAYVAKDPIRFPWRRLL